MRFDYIKKFRHVLKTNKGQSLAEVVVSLAIVASVMIASISLTSNAFRVTKENEIRDRASQLSIQALELFKTPSVLKVNTGLSPTGNIQGSYAYSADSSGEYGLVMRSINPDTVITTCDNSSPYKVEVVINNNPLIMCQQITIKRQTQGTVYIMKSRVIYNLGKELFIEDFQAFRGGDIESDV